MKSLVGTELKRFLRNYKRNHIRIGSLAIVLQSVEYPYNVGSIFRLADGAGVTELILTGITPTPPHPTISKVGRSKDRNVPWRYEPDPLVAIGDLRDQGYHIVALELTNHSVPYHQYAYPLKCCLVVGNEDHGVTKKMLAACDAAVFIPMYGKGRSLNVNTALSVITYHMLQAERID